MCRDRVGEVVGNSRVDEFGDKIVSQNLTGGGWLSRHDTIKSELNSYYFGQGCQLYVSHIVSLASSSHKNH